MKILGVIFDLDGVICYTDELHYQSWKKIANEEGIYFDKEINNRLRGISRLDSLNIILENSKKTYSDEEKENLMQKKNNFYREYLLKLSRKDVDKDVFDTLYWLKLNGYKIGLGSSSKNTKLILKQLELDTIFDAVSDGNDISHSKPNPEVYMHTCTKLDLIPSNCLVIEDAMVGIDAANNGGFISVAIGDARKHSNARYKINKLSDILNIIKENNAL